MTKNKPLSEQENKYILIYKSCNYSIMEVTDPD